MDFKKNGFLIGIVAGLVVAVIVLAALVVPAWSEASTQEDTVKNTYSTTLNQITGGGSVPTPKWVSGITQHLGTVNEESKKLYNFYNESDLALERWFDNAPPANIPQKGVLMSRATDGILQMLRDLRGAMGDANVPKDGTATYGEMKVLGFEFPLSDAVPDDPNEKKKWMRVYNIHSRIKDVLIEAHAQRFYRVQFSKVSGPPEITARQVERPLSNGLGQTIPFVVEASFNWKDLPAFTDALLKYDPAKPGPMLHIVMMHIERDLSPVYMPKAEIEVEVDKADFDSGEWKKKVPPPTEPALRVTALIEAYDFNFPENRLK